MAVRKLFFPVVCLGCVAMAFFSLTMISPLRFALCLLRLCLVFAGAPESPVVAYVTPNSCIRDRLGNSVLSGVMRHGEIAGTTLLTTLTLQAIGWWRKKLMALTFQAIGWCQKRGGMAAEWKVARF